MEEGEVGALRELEFETLFDQGAKFHVDVCQLRKGIGVTSDNRSTKGQEPLFPLGESVRFEAAELCQRNLPRGENRIV